MNNNSQESSSPSTKIELCYWYNTTGWPDFKPFCNKGLHAGLKCHSKCLQCIEYISYTDYLIQHTEPNISQIILDEWKAI